MAGRRRSSEDGDGSTRPSSRRRRASSPEVPDDADADTLWESLPLDMIWEILLLLPPQRPSLVRASTVNTLWRGVATDPDFMSQSRRKWKPPPLLGVFERRRQKFCFTPVLHPPDGIPADRIHISGWMTSRDCDVTDCRHSRLLAIDCKWLFLFSPITGEERNLPVPREFRKCNYHNGAVICAASGQDHVHGFCHNSPFKVALLSIFPIGNRFITSVYSSETRQWGHDIFLDAPFEVALAVGVPATLVRNVLYWMLSSNNVCAAMLEFDLDRQSLAVIKRPSDMIDSGSHWIIKTEQGTVGWLRFSFPSLEIWLRKKKNCHGLATWSRHKTVDMHDILGIPPRSSNKVWQSKLRGYDETNNVIILLVDDSAYMVDLNSMKSTKLDGRRSSMNRCHPFTSFYPPDMAI